MVYACVAPHGGELIPKLAGPQLKLFSPTRKGMRRLGSQMRDAKPDAIVIASPHNLRLPKHIGVVISENTSGVLAEGAREVRLKAGCDLALGSDIIRESEEAGLPVVGANYGALEGPLSDLQMDWGTLVPLWFLMHETHMKCKVVIVTPSRGIPLRQNVDFGAAVGRAAQAYGKRVAFVASADQAHAHRKDGPYGYSPMAKEYDKRVVEAVESGRLRQLMSVSRKLVDRAKPDSLWQLAVLAGVLSVAPLDGELFSYQVPTYYGMLCAGFTKSGDQLVFSRERAE